MNNPLSSITVPFEAIHALATYLGAMPLNRWPDCWEVDVDAHWRIAINGHAEDRPAHGTEGAGVYVPPFSALVWFNGWPAGLLDARGGEFAAGEAANAAAFMRAIEARIGGAR